MPTQFTQYCFNHSCLCQLIITVISRHNTCPLTLLRQHMAYCPLTPFPLPSSFSPCPCIRIHQPRQGPSQTHECNTRSDGESTQWAKRAQERLGVGQGVGVGQGQGQGQSASSSLSSSSFLPPKRKRATDNNGDDDDDDDNATMIIIMIGMVVTVLLTMMVLWTRTCLTGLVTLMDSFTSQCFGTIPLQTLSSINASPNFLLTHLPSISQVLSGVSSSSHSPRMHARIMWPFLRDMGIASATATYRSVSFAPQG